MIYATDKKNLPFRKFLLLWSGELISSAGSGLTAFGLAVYVFRQTGKASAVALVTLFGFLPSLLLSAPAGILADRYDRRLLMITGDFLSAAGPLFILVNFIHGKIDLWYIYIGVAISSVFSALLEPAYRATTSDLLTKDRYTKAAGFISAATSAKYLISPVLAGFLLTVSDIRLLLVIDISTFFFTCLSTLVVRKGLPAKQDKKKESFLYSLSDGWQAVTGKQGVIALVMLATAVTFFIGFIQTLSAPMILAFSDSSVLGSVETISATGMFASSVLLGLFPIRKKITQILYGSLFMAGFFMILFGLRAHIGLISVSGFLFFAMLPPVNTCLDYLIRTNIDNSVQGRAWGLIGLVSQLGYIAAYISCGLLSDRVFSPLLTTGGPLAGSLGRVFGTGPGRGAGLLIAVSGVFLCIAAAVQHNGRTVRKLTGNQYI